ncbi:hypothetical protein [Streptomyces cahuitamycinicus]|uniref:hypothetical protein n=1 Tax=Streptomyces cahuitamycinicus TaxID=2070367 RepID=UPI0015E14424|nr:hypothetical protein [Streptomyces cahuitamycinicus]
MRAAERRALLGDDVIAQIRERVATTPEPPTDVVDALRPIFARPARRRVTERVPAADAA